MEVEENIEKSEQFVCGELGEPTVGGGGFSPLLWGDADEFPRRGFVDQRGACW